MGKTITQLLQDYHTLAAMLANLEAVNDTQHSNTSSLIELQTIGSKALDDIDEAEIL